MKKKETETGKETARPFPDKTGPKPGCTAALVTVCDFIRYAVSRFTEADLFFGHGTDNGFDEAAFIVLEALGLPPERLDSFWNARLTEDERAKLTALIHDRIASRKPAPYLVNKAYIQGMPFYVDERVIVPRSFIGELINAEDAPPFADREADISSVLDLCTGSGCLAVLAAHTFPQASVDAIDLSPAALDVARRNVADYGLEERITLYKGDLFSALPPEKRYDLIISNPPYVDREGMERLPPEYRHEPAMALEAGDDGLDIVRRILAQAAAHLNEGGGLLCEIGRCRESLELAFPRLPFLWLDTADSSGEVFWIGKDSLT